MKIVKLVGVALLILVGLYFLDKPKPGMSNTEKWRDWQLIFSVGNEDSSMNAVLERNIHFGSEGYKPIIRVALVGGGARRVVWRSGEASAPSLVWKKNSVLSIQYEHNSAAGYRPAIRIDNVNYHILLDMDIDNPPHYTHSWDDGWRWKKIEEIQNIENGFSATVVVGEHMTSNSAPIVRVLLPGEGGELFEVWSGSEPTSEPEISWLNEDTLQILVNDYHSYTYFPTKKVFGDIYEVVLQEREKKSHNKAL